jgi:type VI protein secretion system component VasF
MRRARAITVPDVSTDLSPSDRARERDRERARARRGRTRRRVLVWLVRLVAAAVLLFAGIAIGRALESDGESEGTNTSVRTLEVTTLTPQETVTVTVSNP